MLQRLPLGAARPVWVRRPFLCRPQNAEVPATEVRLPNVAPSEPRYPDALDTRRQRLASRPERRPYEPIAMTGADAACLLKRRIEWRARSVVVPILLREGLHSWPRFCRERHCGAVQPLRPWARSVVARSLAQGRVHVLSRGRPVVRLARLADPSLVDSGRRHL